VDLGQVKTVPQETIDAIPRGPDLPSKAPPPPVPSGIAEGDLIKGPGHPEIFLVEGGVRRCIPDESTLLFWWTWDQVKTVPHETIDAIPRGPDLQHRAGLALQAKLAAGIVTVTRCGMTDPRRHRSFARDRD
jgi:hypothetical protein